MKKMTAKEALEKARKDFQDICSHTDRYYYKRSDTMPHVHVKHCGTCDSILHYDLEEIS